MNTTGWFLGVDGGQSSTIALIGDQTGRVVGEGRAGPCNHAGVEDGRARFLEALGGCVQAALQQAGLQEVTFEAACFGFSGGPADKEALTRDRIQSKRYVITHDAEIALIGAAAGEPGIVTIAGTGSIAFGRNHEGRTARAGGWGYLFGDEGGAFDLVRQAMRAILRHEEGWGPPTSLRERLLDFTGDRTANDLLHRFYTGQYPRERIASLATLVDQAAEAGDGIAQDILKLAAQSLAALQAAVRRQLFEAGEPVLVSYVGGVFQSRVVRERFRILAELEDAVHVAPPRYGPAAGALIGAYRAADLACNPASPLPT